MIENIQCGRVYRAKTPRQVGADRQFHQGFVNDRVVIYINVLSDLVQYDGPAIPNGRHYPKCTLKAFREWAGEDVTDVMPVGEWQPWSAPSKVKSPINPSAVIAGDDQLEVDDAL